MIRSGKKCDKLNYSKNSITSLGVIHWILALGYVDVNCTGSKMKKEAIQTI
jgi:hypothetical protein